jgi:hypothetical protein
MDAPMKAWMSEDEMPEVSPGDRYDTAVVLILGIM